MPSRRPKANPSGKPHEAYDGGPKKAMEERAVEFLKRALGELMKAVKRILERFHVDAIISFGSRAKGDHEPRSGCDVFIIAGFEGKTPG